MGAISEDFRQLVQQDGVGYPPFAWQHRLLLDHLLKGRLPDSLAVPTGLGKTAVMALWLMALGRGAPLPRRLVYVVDRRTVVDQATAYAEVLRGNLAEQPGLAERLGLPRDLAVSTLRGQFADNGSWRADPAAPSIIVGTVDMIGSRLLFEGYGVSPAMRPFHAGLLGCDALILLDEAHLSVPFARLVEQVLRAQDGGSAPPLRLLTLSATGLNGGQVFRLREEEQDEQEVARRLRAVKRLRIEDAPDEDALGFARRAWELAGQTGQKARILIYRESREEAVKIGEALRKEARSRKAEWEIELLTGARRGHERDNLAERLHGLGFFGGSEPPEAPAFLVATSAGEVGIDLDADHMICDLVAWDRMVQRLGRVNRRGRGRAEIVVLDLGKGVLGKCSAEEAPRRAETRRLLESLLACEDGRDASPAALDALQTAEELTGAVAPPPLYPALAPPLVEAWAMTSLDDHAGRPECAPWLRGWVEDEPQTVVVWRQHLPQMRDGDDEAWPERKLIESFFKAAPVAMAERLETRSDRVLSWLLDRGKSLAKGEIEARKVREDRLACLVLDRAGGLRGGWTFAALARMAAPKASRTRAASRDLDALKGLLPHRMLVVDAEIGGLSDGLLDPKVAERVQAADAEDGAEFMQGIRFAVRPMRAEDEGLVAPAPLRGWRLVRSFETGRDAGGKPDAGLAVYKRPREATDEVSRSVSRPLTIAEHAAAVECRVADLAVRLGLPEPIAEALRLAARHHDAGKAAARWQRAAGATGPEPLAKTDGRGANWTLLGGYRHEFGSLLRLRDADLPEAERDLILHLVAAHHGRARPLIPADGCDDVAPSAAATEAGAAALRFAQLQRRYGPWGLAWLEALLRAADQRASAEGEGKDG